MEKLGFYLCALAVQVGAHLMAQWGRVSSLHKSLLQKIPQNDGHIDDVQICVCI